MAQQSGGQGGGTPEERAQRSLDRLKASLTLNADQEAKSKRFSSLKVNLRIVVYAAYLETRRQRMDQGGGARPAGQ